MTVSSEGFDRLGRDAGRGAPPSRVEKCDHARWVSDEDWNAVGDADRKSRPLLGGDVAIRLAIPQPAFPPAGVHDYARAMNLTNRHEASRRVREIPLDRAPAGHNFVDWIIARQHERPGYP